METSASLLSFNSTLVVRGICQNCFPDDSLSWSTLSSFLLPSCPVQPQCAIVAFMVHSVQFLAAKLPCQAAECHIFSQMKQLPTFSSSNSPSSRHVWVFWAFLTSLYLIKQCPKLNMSILLSLSSSNPLETCRCYSCL